jgi:nucleoside-diphosphate-sugar epimerase
LKKHTAHASYLEAKIRDHGNNMRVFVAGAGGAIGTALIPVLAGAGHHVIGMTRSPERAQHIRELGAEHVAVDALDEPALVRAVESARPDVIVHELTNIPRKVNVRRFDDDFRATNRLRIEGTDHLIRAAQAAGVRRIVAQSFGAWPYARVGGPVKSEEDPLDSNPPRAMRETLRAIRYLEERVTGTLGLEGIALRYGFFYGPESAGGIGSMLEDVRRRRFPIVGDGGGVWSFIHVADAARATLAAAERGEPGLYNITDDEPAPVAEWLPGLARIIGAPPPRHAPVWLARLMVGESGVVLMTQIRGASNQKAKRILDWKPQWPSWREGFTAEYGVKRGG